MQEKTTYLLNINKQLKQEAQQLAGDIGISLNQVLTILIIDFVRSRQIIITALPRLNEQIETEIEAAIDRYKNDPPIVLRDRGSVAREMRRMQ